MTLESSVVWLQMTRALALMLFIVTVILRLCSWRFFQALFSINNMRTWTWFLGTRGAKWSRHQPSDYSICPLSRGRNQHGWAKWAGTDHYDQWILCLLFWMRLWNISLQFQTFPATGVFSSHSGSVKIRATQGYAFSCVARMPRKSFLFVGNPCLVDSW